MSAEAVPAAAETVPTGTAKSESAPPLICACGATEGHGSTPNMCVNGHFVAGNQARRIHGVRAFETTGRLPDVLRQTVDEFREAVVADRGGPVELSTLEQAYCRRLGETEAVVRLLASDLATRGLFTPRGRVRNTFQRWTEAVSQWDRLAQRIGVARQARAVSLRDYLAQGATAVSAEPKP
jgi:hypothetical protein